MAAKKNQIQIIAYSYAEDGTEQVVEKTLELRSRKPGERRPNLEPVDLCPPKSKRRRGAQ